MSECQHDVMIVGVPTKYALCIRCKKTFRICDLTFHQFVASEKPDLKGDRLALDLEIWLTEKSIATLDGFFSKGQISFREYATRLIGLYQRLETLERWKGR